MLDLDDLHGYCKAMSSSSSLRHKLKIIRIEFIEKLTSNLKINLTNCQNLKLVWAYIFHFKVHILIIIARIKYYAYI